MTYKQTVFRICLGFCRDPWDAEELTQEVYLKAYVKLDTLKDPGRKREWLFRVARNTCLDHVKQLKRRRTHGTVTPLEPGVDAVDDRGGTPETLAAQARELKQLKEVIARLPAKLQEVLVLKEYADLSYREIAASLGIKEGTVMSRLNRARQTVIKRMRNRCVSKGQDCHE